MKSGLAKAGEVEGNGDLLAVGGDDFDGGVVGGDVGCVVYEPGLPAGGAGVGVGVVCGGIGGDAKVFGDKGEVT